MFLLDLIKGRSSCKLQVIYFDKQYEPRLPLTTLASPIAPVVFTCKQGLPKPFRKKNKTKELTCKAAARRTLSAFGLISSMLDIFRCTFWRTGIRVQRIISRLLIWTPLVAASLWGSISEFIILTIAIHCIKMLITTNIFQLIKH
jgi:hypothetical protein